MHLPTVPTQRLLLCCCAVEIISYYVFLLIVLANWCDLDSGITTITDGRGFPFSVYISVTRDGSVWIRTGSDYKSHEWHYTDESQYTMQTTLVQVGPPFLRVILSMLE